jgi:tetratricopeptide (TPR) repeat protein
MIPDPAHPDDATLDAVRGLDTIDASQTVSASIDDREHFKRANIYQFNRDFEKARRHYMAVINDSRGSDLAPEATLQIGRGYAMLLDHTEAVQWFERVLEQYPGHAIGSEAQLNAASSYARVGKYREAVHRYKAYIAQFPEGERIDRAYLNVIDVLRDQREEIEAVKWADTLRTKFQGRQPAALATFAEVRIYLARSNWESAIEALDRLEKYSDLGGAAVPGGTTRSEIRFLRGYALEQLRRYSEAIDVYLSIPDGRNEYFGWRATERLRMLAIDPNAKRFVEAKSAELKALKPPDADDARRNLQSVIRLTESLDEKKKLLTALRSVYAALPAYSLPKVVLVKNGRQSIQKGSKATTLSTSVAEELLFLGLFDEAAPEMESKISTATPSPDLNYTIADLLHPR